MYFTFQGTFAINGEKFDRKWTINGEKFDCSQTFKLHCKYYCN